MKATLKVDGRFGAQFEGVYEFRQVTQGEYERVLVSYMDALGKVAKQSILKLNREMLFLSLIAQPENKPLTRDVVVQGRLPYGLSIKLQEAYDRVNGIGLEEERFLSLPSNEKQPIPSSQNLSSAKSLAGQSSNTTAPAGEP
jgi:hypothetical protein